MLLLLLKGVLSGHKSVTGMLPNNPKMVPPFSFLKNFHPYLSDRHSGRIIRLERSRCCNQNGHSVVIRLLTTWPARCVQNIWQLCSNDAAVVF